MATFPTVRNWQLTKPETAEPETAKPETAKPETAKPETGERKQSCLSLQSLARTRLEHHLVSVL
jgi:hypothetical protein